MLIIQDMIVDEEILTVEFACDLAKCRGRCCVIGNVGPPLTRAETRVLDQIVNLVRPQLSPESQRQIEHMGPWRSNGYEYYGAILPGDGPCVFAVETGGIWMCALQNIHLDHRPVKPLSCRTFPLWIYRSGAMYHVRLHLYGPCHLCIGCGTSLLDSLKSDIVACLGDKRYRALAAQSGRLRKRG